MNVLVIGDEHIHGYGLSAGQLSYVGHFVRQLSRAGQRVSVEAYAHLTLPQVQTTLAQCPLDRYDLIILQLDAALLQAGRSSALLKQLRPYRHAVLLLTPLPHRKWSNQWQRRRGRAALLRIADEQFFSVFDSDLVIQPREEYFLPDDRQHLNAVSHELLGRSLVDFYESAPTIVTIQVIRR